jgi:hypothetical protein
MFWKFLNDRRNLLNKKKEEKYEIYKKFYEKEQENDQQVKEKKSLKSIFNDCAKFRIKDKISMIKN